MSRAGGIHAGGFTYAGTASSDRGRAWRPSRRSVSKEPIA
jgi:hypothetical protein